MMINNIELITNRYHKNPDKAGDQLLLLILDSKYEYKQVDYFDSINYLDRKLRLLYNPKQQRETQQISLFDIGDECIDKDRDPDLRWNKKQVLKTIKSWMLDHKHLFNE